MTLPVSGTMSLSDVLAEIRLVTPGRAVTLSLGDTDVLNLAGKSGTPISLSDLYGKSSYIPMTVTGVNSYNNTFSSANAGTASARPSVTVSGGSGGYTYAWSITSQSIPVTLINANSASCTVTKSYTQGSSGSFDVFLQCVVTDNTGHSVTATNIEATASWGVQF